MQRYILYIGITLFAFACKQPAKEEHKTPENEIAQMLVHYNDDIKLHGLLAEFSYLDSSAQFFWMPPGYTIGQPYDSVAKAIRVNAMAIKKIENTWDSIAIHMETDSTAFYSGSIHSTVTDTSGNVSSTVLKENGMVIKRKDGWKLLSGKTELLQK